MDRTQERFWSHVDKTDAGCWNWTGSTTAKGYGRFTVKDADGVWRNGFAHRYAYALLVGPIPDGLTIDHLCRNTQCVRPSHLDAVSVAENTRRALSTTTCKRGHVMDDDNTYVRPDRNTRQCRACQRERNRQWERRTQEVAS